MKDLKTLDNNNGSAKRMNPLTAVLIAANLILFLVIMISWTRAGKEEPRPEPSSDPGLIVVEHTTPKPSDLPKEEPVIAETEEPSATPEPQTPVPEVIHEDERRPTYHDFSWYIDDVSHNGIWRDAEVITDLGEILGEWKAYIQYDPDNLTGNPCDILFNADISVGQNAIEVLCDWYYVKYETDEEPTYQTNAQSHFSGTWSDGRIHAEGPGTMDLTEFFTKGGYQFAIGTMKDTDGIPGTIVLVRQAAAG